VVFTLKEAMRVFLTDWTADLDAPWRALLAQVAPNVDAIADALKLEVWEPIFPVRRGKHLPGMPAGAHCFRAFDGIAPDAVRCVILGQDPYPDPSFATGRAFEAGNVVQWCELDKSFSKSIRAYTQLIVAACTGDNGYAGSFENWPKTRAALENGTVVMASPAHSADRWVGQGVLLLNAAFTLTRFRVEIDPHQSAGHLRLWQPIVRQVLRGLAQRGMPLVVIAFGDAATRALVDADIQHYAHVHGIVRAHPAQADAVLRLPNPFVLCNAFLQEMGARPIAW